MSGAPFFCDTSVLIAAADVTHQHYARSRDCALMTGRTQGYCAAHTLAELYATISAIRTPRMRSIEGVLVIVEQYAAHFKPVVLTAQEYVWVLRHVASVEARSGQIYDALILKCAEKSGAEIIYTWNVAHFARVAWPAVASRIRTP